MKINNATPVVNNQVSNNNNSNNQNVAFKGLGQDAGKKLTDLFTLNKQGPMGRNLFVLNAFTFLLGSRLVTSRDKDEKREILIRDLPTIVIAVMGVPVIEKIVAKIVQKNSGFVIMQDAEKSNFAKKIGKLFGKPENAKAKAVVEYGQLDNLYKYDNNLSSGFEGFSKRLADLGGNVKKMFSKIDDKEIQEGLKSLKDTKNNDEFISGLIKNADLSDKIKKALSNPKNKILQQASFLKTLTKIAGFGATLALIGILIPNLNIYITETINKKKKPVVVQPITQQTEVTEPVQVAGTKKAKEAFKEFASNK